MANRVLLKNISQITSGSAAPKDQFFSNIGLPFIRAGHLETLIESNNIDELPKISDEDAKQLKLKKVEPGTILFAKSGMSCTKNRIYECTQQAYIVSHLAAIKPDTKYVNSSYLRYFFKWFQPSQLIVDESYPSIRTSDIGNIEIHLPSMEDQAKIVSILNQAVELKNKRKSQIRAEEQLAQTIFLDMFGDPVNNSKSWNLEKLEDVTTKITDGTHDTPDRLTSGVLLITGKNIRPYKIDFSQLEYVSQEDHKIIYSRCNPEYGDILYTNIGVNLGTATMNPLHEEFSMKNVALLKLRRDVVHSRYMEFLLNHPGMKNKIIELSSSGGAQKFLSLNKIKLVEVPIPPQEIQLKFSNMVEELLQKKVSMEKGLSYLEELKHSLMKQSFKNQGYK